MSLGGVQVAQDQQEEPSASDESGLEDAEEPAKDKGERRARSSGVKESKSDVTCLALPLEGAREPQQNKSLDFFFVLCPSLKSHK